jgi:transcriptional regulator with PAS, ATPase and Fis domain
MRRRTGETFEVALGDCLVLGSTIAVIRRAPMPPQAPGSSTDIRDTTRSSGRYAPHHPVMQKLREQACEAAQSTFSILLLGETGVGKEVLAREIHRCSPRASGPFLAIHCAALPESLLEGELFGYEKGAFTGAVQARPGLFEAAHGGTVLLDEIGELPMGFQVKLLRVLEERSVLRVGARAPRHVDVRFIAATHRNLEAEIARGAFRQDLFFRLDGFTLTIPPLRARVSEIADLAGIFIATAQRQLDRALVPVLSPEALALLERYPWPGNLRELRNAMERAVVLCAGDTLLPEHLPAKIAAHPDRRDSGITPAPDAPATLRIESHEELVAAKEALEYRRIVEALNQCGGNQTRAAKLLDISRRTLVTKLGLYNLPRPKKGT